MFVQERTARILSELDKKPRQTTAALQRRLGVSVSTLRRDLIELEAAGEVVRVHGGVMRSGRSLGEPTFDRKQKRAVCAKQAIAKAAATLVPSDAQVFIDGGTTCLHVARLLMHRDDLTLWTNSIRLLTEAESARAAVYSIGGQVRGRSMSLMGGMATRWLGHLHVDVAFLGASGMDNQGPCTTDLHDAAVKDAVIQSADQTILVADASKWNAPTPVRFSAWENLDAWVTDKAKGSGIRLPAKCGCKVRRVRHT